MLAYPNVVWINDIVTTTFRCFVHQSDLFKCFKQLSDEVIEQSRILFYGPVEISPEIVRKPIRFFTSQDGYIKHVIIRSLKIDTYQFWETYTSTKLPVQEMARIILPVKGI